MKTVEHLGKLYVVDGVVDAPDGAIFLDTLPADKLVELRNLLVSGLDAGRDIKMFQSKGKGIKLVIALLLKWDVEFDDELPEEMQPEPKVEPARQVPAPEGPETIKVVPTGKVRDGSKQAALIDLLKRPEGASIKEISAALTWLPHTTRGAISRDLKKRLSLPVTKSRIEGRGQVYRIAS